MSLLLDGCIGIDRADPISRTVLRRPLQPTLPRTVAVLASLVDQATLAMRRAVESVAALLAAAGTQVEVVTVDDLEVAHAAHLTVMRSEIASVHADLYADHAAAYAPQISGLIETGSRVAATDYLRALRYRSLFRRELEQTTRHFDVLLAPAAVGAAEANLDTIGSPVMNLLAAFVGLPAITLPAARSESGLPLGVQLIGHQDGDEQLLAVAEAVEERLDFRRPELPIVTPAAPSQD